MDIVGATLGLLLLAPLMLLTAMWIKLDSTGSVLFLQLRVGRYGEPFQIYKFRSMVTGAPGMGPSITVAEDPRITRAGKFLRRYKLDELPQLWNVLVGDMSLVGPRPEVPEYVALYTNAQKEKILSLRPGITDLASLEFSNESDLLAASEEIRTSYATSILPRKLRLYESYVDERSLALDLRIVFATIMVLLFRAGKRRPLNEV